jgi:hypothetical protein
MQMCGKSKTGSKCQLAGVLKDCVSWEDQSMISFFRMLTCICVGGVGIVPLTVNLTTAVVAPSGGVK